MSKTFDLLHLRHSGTYLVEGLFKKAHSHNWDPERDVDWSVPFEAGDPLMAPGWAPYSRTATYKALSKQARAHVTRRSFSFMLNSLRLGELVAEEICFKVGLKSRLSDHKAHAAAQAMDEARHAFVYTRILDAMEETPEEIDPRTRATFDQVLALDNVPDMVAWEQFYLESLAMNVLRHAKAHARHPVLKQVFALNLRDESRHMGFGVTYVAEQLAALEEADRFAFARRWLDQILTLSFGQQDPTAITRVTRWLFEAGVDNSVELAGRMLQEQGAILQAELQAIQDGTRVPQELKSARRAGLMAPDILEALGLSQHPLILGTLRGKEDAA